MQYRELRWRKLIPGALLVIGLVLTALVVLVRVGLGKLPGKKFTMYALTDQARGMVGGSDIWLAGQRAGVVSSVVFLPATAAGVGDSVTAGRILLKLEILEEFQHLIARNSRAQIRGGSRFLGNPVLHVSLGLPGQQLVRPGDTIVTMAQFDAEAVAGKVEAAMALLPLVMRDLKTAMASASGLDSLLALVLTSADAKNAQSPLQELLSSLGQLTQRLDDGSLGLFTHDAALSSRMKSVSSSTDSLSRFYSIEGSSLDRFLRDTVLFARIDSIAVRFSAIMATYDAKFDLTGARGEALRTGIDRLTASLKALRNDARRHPFRYIVF